MNSTYHIDEKWIKASIIGAIWAASEIVLGSFMHNLKIPFSSNILTGIGIIILVSTSHVWTEKGLFWRAGLICALMKTMSPSALIFGPMIAIFSQALLLEVAVRIFGKTVFGYLSGAILAMSWNLFQRIMNFIIFYGYNIVDVYSDLLKFVRRQLDLQFEIIWLPILILLVIYAILGIIAATIGIRVGRKIKHQPAEPISPTRRSEFFTPRSGQQSFNWSIRWLVLNLLLTVTALLLLNFTPWPVWIVFITAIVLLWVKRYRQAFRQLAKPRFWFYFVGITMVTAFVFNKMQGHEYINGLLIGLQMNFRAVVIILGFSVLGAELYNPLIKEFFLKHSFKQLPLALELSFESLPLIIAGIPDFKEVAKNPVTVFYRIISQIEARLERIKRNLSKKVFIVSGNIGEGKTSSIEELVQNLKSQNIKIGGIFSPRIMEDDETIGYDIIDISTNRREIFLRKTNSDQHDKIGNYSIFENGLQAGIKALDQSINDTRQLVVIDEVGKLELSDKGWAANINHWLHYSDADLLISVRSSFTEQVIQKWNLKNYTIFNVSEYDQQAFSRIISDHLN
ncbi:MAG: hypothetical protein KDF60_15270 [Calditrichaeota bacterium]|nr:hypothetical protein [Calditrichota bacterium]